jgi:hypothetical protein
MDIARTSPIERIARVLAAYALSRNCEGDMDSAGEAVDALWSHHAEPRWRCSRPARTSTRMAQAGDPAIWERMVQTAIEDELGTA